MIVDPMTSDGSFKMQRLMVHTSIAVSICESKMCLVSKLQPTFSTDASLGKDPPLQQVDLFMIPTRWLVTLKGALVCAAIARPFCGSVLFICSSL